MVRMQTKTLKNFLKRLLRMEHRQWKDGDYITHDTKPSIDNMYCLRRTSAISDSFDLLDRSNRRAATWTDAVMIQNFSRDWRVMPKEEVAEIHAQVEKERKERENFNKGVYIVKELEKIGAWQIKFNNSYAIASPTANCQVACIGGYEGLSPYKDKRRLMLRTLNEVCNKKMFLIDIRSGAESYVTEIFGPTDIVMRQPYTSTNESNMIIFLVKTRNL